MSKLLAGRHARVNGAPVNWPDDDDYRGRVMAVEHITEDGLYARLYDISTPMVRGIESLPLFRAGGQKLIETSRVNDEDRESNDGTDNHKQARPPAAREDCSRMRPRVCRFSMGRACRRLPSTVSRNTASAHHPRRSSRRRARSTNNPTALRSSAHCSTSSSRRCSWWSLEP